MTPEQIEQIKNPWSCFVDACYFDKWAIQHVERRSFNQAIHVNTKEEAGFLVKQLNRMEQLAGLLEWIYEEADSDNRAFKLPDEALDKIEEAIYSEEPTQ